MSACFYCGSKAAYWTILDKENNMNHYCDPCFQSHNLAERKKEMDDFHQKRRREIDEARKSTHTSSGSQGVPAPSATPSSAATRSSVPPNRKLTSGAVIEKKDGRAATEGPRQAAARPRSIAASRETVTKYKQCPKCKKFNFNVTKNLCENALCGAGTSSPLAASVPSAVPASVQQASPPPAVSIPSRTPVSAQQMRNRNDLLQAIAASFSSHPHAILRYGCFDNSNDLVNIWSDLQEMRERTRQSSTDFLVEAAGDNLQLKERHVQEAISMGEKILAGTSGNYKTVTLLVNDWDRSVLGRMKDRFLGKCSILGS